MTMIFNVDHIKDELLEKINDIASRIVTQATGISVSDTVANMLGLSGTNKNVEYAFRNIANIIPKDVTVYNTLFNGSYSIGTQSVSSFQLSDITSNYNELIIISEGINGGTANANDVYISFNSSAGSDNYGINIVLVGIPVSRYMIYRTGFVNSPILNIYQDASAGTVVESKAFNNKKMLYIFNNSTSRTATGNIKVIGVKYKIN